MSHSVRGGPDWRANVGASGAVWSRIASTAGLAGGTSLALGGCVPVVPFRTPRRTPQEAPPMRTLSLITALTALTFSAGALAAQSTSQQPASKPAMNQTSAVHMKQDTTTKKAS